MFAQKKIGAYKWAPCARGLAHKNGGGLIIENNQKSYKMREITRIGEK
jgi:hypothetical protein